MVQCAEFRCQSNREIELWPAKDETFIFSRSAPLTALSSRRTITPCNKRKIDTECIFNRCIRCLYFTTIREIVQKQGAEFNSWERRIREFHSFRHCTGLLGSYRLSSPQRYKRYRSRPFGQCRCGQIAHPADPMNPCYPSQRK